MDIHLKIIDKNSKIFRFILRSKKFKMKKILLIFNLLFLPIFLFSAFLQLSPSAKLAAISDISLLDESVSSIFYNPATFDKIFSISSSYFVPFSLPDLKYLTGAIGYKFEKFHFAVGLQQFGNEIYKEQTGIFVTNVNISKNLSLGMSYRFLQKNVSEMNDEIDSQFDIGMMATFDKFQFSSSFLNCGFDKIGNDNLPQESRTEISYQIYENLKTGISFVKELDYPFSFHFGTVYYPIKKFGILSGFETEPERFSAGLEFNIQKIQIIYGIKTHQYLDITHYITVSYQ